MERLVIDAEGKMTLPSALIQRRGLRPGDSLELVEAAEGLLLYQGGVDAETMAWWSSPVSASRTIEIKKIKVAQPAMVALFDLEPPRCNQRA
jgi:bifunctional DNA-binding transcriptional regulator/antitoxin component of YhaV-PrlF toxin-antitoxin module